MLILDPSGTTVTADNSREGSAAQRVLSILWAFPDAEGRPEPISRGRTLIGRADDCDIQLPGSEISRHHAEILRDGTLHLVRDLASRNGVFHNGLRVPQGLLREADVIRLGEWVGIVTTAGQDGEERVGEVAPGMFGGRALRDLVELAQRAAKNALPVVIEGDTGTGKELFSRAIHGFSGRTGPFVAVNCAALPEALAEAELFGYRKGAFTGADRASVGHFRAAHGGTIMLDEIVDMPMSLQAKLLRVLEEREVLPLGESMPVPIDVQVVVAAQSSLRQAVAERRFRGDLLARLSGVTVRLPRLRERRAEIPFLLLRLLDEHSGGVAPAVEGKLVESLCLHGWPFNLRELDLVVRRLLALHGDEPVLRRAHLSLDRVEAAGPSDEPLPEHDQARELAPKERDRRDLRALLVALRRHNGNVARASSAVHITRQRAYRLLAGSPEVRLEDLRDGGEAPPQGTPSTPEARPEVQ